MISIHSHRAQARLLGALLILSMLASLPSCLDMFVPPSKPTATDNVGPKPVNAAAIIAAWANSRYQFIPNSPFTADEFLLSEPVPIAYFEIPFGRIVGWQVISGPENKRLQGEIELNYTQFIIHNGHVISVVSQDYPFRGP